MCMWPERRSFEVKNLCLIVSHMIISNTCMKTTRFSLYHSALFQLEDF